MISQLQTNEPNIHDLTSEIEPGMLSELRWIFIDR